MILEAKNISAGYGKKQILFNTSIQVQKGEIVSIIGPNGSGKSTLLKVISGMLSAWNGEVFFKDKNITDKAVSNNVKEGLVYSPQGHLAFSDLPVIDNLKLGALYLPKNDFLKMLNRVLETFPGLRNRLKQNAGFLSGGEQQMLSLARILIGQPSILLLDEPSLGLSPKLLDTCFEMISQIVEKYNVSILIVEQKVRKVLELSNRTYGISLGKIVYEGDSKELIKESHTLADIFL